MKKFFEWLACTIMPEKACDYTAEVVDLRFQLGLAQNTIGIYEDAVSAHSQREQELELELRRKQQAYEAATAALESKLDENLRLKNELENCRANLKRVASQRNFRLGQVDRVNLILGEECPQDD